MRESDVEIRPLKRVEYEFLVDQGFFEPGERIELIDGLRLFSTAGTSQACMPVPAGPSTGSSTSSTARSRSAATQRPQLARPTAGTTRPPRFGAKGTAYLPWPRPEPRSRWPTSCRSDWSAAEP